MWKILSRPFQLLCNLLNTWQNRHWIKKVLLYSNLIQNILSIFPAYIWIWQSMLHKFNQNLIATILINISYKYINWPFVKWKIHLYVKSHTHTYNTHFDLSIKQKGLELVALVQTLLHSKKKWKGDWCSKVVNGVSMIYNWGQNNCCDSLVLKSQNIRWRVC